MLWDLYGDEANKVYRCWSTAAKLVWDVPRQTATFVVNQVLTGQIKPVTTGILTDMQGMLRASQTTTHLRLEPSSAA